MFWFKWWYLPSLICWRPCLTAQTFSQHTPLLPDTPGHMRHKLVLRDRGQDDPERGLRCGQAQGSLPLTAIVRWTIITSRLSGLENKHNIYLYNLLLFYKLENTF